MFIEFYRALTIDVAHSCLGPASPWTSLCMRSWGGIRATCALESKKVELLDVGRFKQAYEKLRLVRAWHVSFYIGNIWDATTIINISIYAQTLADWCHP